MVNMSIDKWVESDMYEILVSEEYMEDILRREGFKEIDDEYGTDSNLVCEYAIWELGFQNLGDFGTGFVFMQNRDNMKKSILDKYFR